MRRRWAILLVLIGVGALAATAGRSWMDRTVPADMVLQEEMPAPTSAGGEGGLLALTFDDGPRRSTTTALLDGLAERGVKATFFLVGSRVAEHSTDLLQRMEREGHQIGIHTYDHVALTALSTADFAAQVDKTRDLFRSVLGREGFPLRPPYGMVDDGVRNMAGCPIVLWSIDPEDWDDQDAARVTEHIVSRARDGDIILLHDIFSSSVDAALAAVDRLHRQGFYFVTVEELFAARQIPMEPGKVYRCAYP
ncbi:polysaccharide deacetylase family protein [Pseudoflavonifractor sp. MSJ-37]|uniref:polysaccharide deacetylase family protein n=1 Tax=Pseudoflavonifractor sp. MSJ-37 TaxID=2841531 RepID=UPI001C0F9376|nr:polysaccharide deacetylase family protein [Pseudoflavonifractor sp. MSJ-37]MBU5434943.1 polysaccharide deacetylase family protein [Pseudoflavonifractor sp. MSJ-37]